MGIRRNNLVYDVEYYDETIKGETQFELVDITKKEFPSVEELIPILKDFYNYFLNKQIEYVLDDNNIDISDIKLEYIQDLHKYNEEILKLKDKYYYLFDAIDMGLL